MYIYIYIYIYITRRALVRSSIGTYDRGRLEASFCDFSKSDRIAIQDSVDDGGSFGRGMGLVYANGVKELI